MRLRGRDACMCESESEIVPNALNAQNRNRGSPEEVSRYAGQVANPNMMSSERRGLTGHSDGGPELGVRRVLRSRSITAESTTN